MPSPPYLLLDKSRATFILFTVSGIAVAYEGGVELLLPQPPVDELLHQRERQGSPKDVNKNDGLHAQNLPHFWVRGLILRIRKQNAITHDVRENTRPADTLRPGC